MRSKFAVEDGVGEAELAMLGWVVAAEGDRGDKGGHRVAGLGDLADDLQFARANRAGVFAGAVDEELVGDGFILPAAGGKEAVAVTILARAVNVERGGGCRSRLGANRFRRSANRGTRAAASYRRRGR